MVKLIEMVTSEQHLSGDQSDASNSADSEGDGTNHPGKNTPQTTATHKKPCSHPVEQLKVLFPAKDFVTHCEFHIAHCAACGFDITSPQPGMDEIAAFYPAGYYGNPGDRRFPPLMEALQKALYYRRVRMVESVGGGRRGRVLDVGCGRGLLLNVFRQRGWEVQGTELTDEAARYARQVAGVPVKVGRLDELGFPDSYFDAVTIWHVLEHVHDPRVALAEVSRILKPGGVVLVGVPNFGGLEARLLKDKWFHLDVPRHITHLTRATLEKAMRENGLECRRWSGFSPEYDNFSFVQSVLNWCGLRHNLLYNILRGKQAKVVSAGERTSQWQVAASLLLGAALGAVSVPATLVTGLIGQAGTLTVFAVKKQV